MSKVASIDFEDEITKKEIMEKYFTKEFLGRKSYTKDEEIVSSPIVRELYFRDKFKEIKDPERIFEEIARQEKNQTIDEESHELERQDVLPIALDCRESARTIAESRMLRDVQNASVEIKEGYRREVLKQQEQEQQGPEI